MNQSVLPAMQVLLKSIPGILYTEIPWDMEVSTAPAAIAARIPWYPLLSRLIITRLCSIRARLSV